MRKARVRSFNDYREAYGLARLTSFEELTSDPEVRQRLEALYRDIDGVVWSGMSGSSPRTTPTKR
jgi:prostaglandin-endoperoxide synthase 2